MRVYSNSCILGLVLERARELVRARESEHERGQGGEEGRRDGDKAREIEGKDQSKERDI